MADEDLVVRARIDDELSRPLEGIADDLDRVGREAETAGGRAGRASRGWSTLGKVAKGALLGITAAAVGAGYAAVRLLSSSFAEAREAQKIGRTTAQIIRSTGGAANVSSRQVGKLAERLSVVAGVDDELIQSGANLLLTFKNVRNEAGKSNKVFDRATAAALDLSAAGFGSVESGSKMLGKALNDPLKGITALSRAGVTFTEGQAKQIEGMVASNDLLGAQKLILAEVESQVGGVAAAQATFGDKAAVMWGNLKERLGTALLPMLEDLSEWFVTDGGPKLERWVGVFEDRGIPALKRFGERARELATEYLPKVKDTLGDVKDVVEPVASAAWDLVNAFLAMPGWAKKAVIGGGLAAYGANKLGLLGSTNGPGGGGSGLLGLVTKAKPLPVFVVNNVPGLGGGKPGAPVPVGGPAGGPKPVPTPTTTGGRFARITNAAKGAGSNLIKGTGGFGSGLLKALTSPITAVTLASSAGVIKAPPMVDPGSDEARAAWRQALKDARHVTDLGTSGAKALEALFGDGLNKDGKADLKLARITRNAEDLAGLVIDPLFAPKGLEQTDRKTREYDRRLDQIKRRPVDPRFTTPGLPDADAGAREFGRKLDQIARPVVTPVDLNTTAAKVKLSDLIASARSAASAIQSFLDFGGGGSTGGAFSDLYDKGKPPKRRERGGPVRAGEPYIVGERRAELFVPNRNGTIVPRIPRQASSGALVLEAGAIVVEVNNPTSDVDVRRAVRDAVLELERERRERGA